MVFLNIFILKILILNINSSRLAESEENQILPFNGLLSFLFLGKLGEAVHAQHFERQPFTALC